MNSIYNYFDSKSNRFYFILITALCFTLYGNTLSHDFAWDDKIVILENDRVQSGLDNFSDFFVKYKSDRLQDKYGYRPVTLISFALDKEIFGLNASGFHFTQILYYALLCISLFILCRLLIPDESPVISFAIVLFFLVHPLHTEVVANIKSRDELFAFLFGILSTYFFLRFYRQSKIYDLPLGIICFVLAFLSKENAIVFLGLIPLTLLAFNKIEWRKIIAPALAIAALGVVSLLILKYAEHSTTGTEITEGLGVYNESLLLGNSFFFNSYLLTDKLANASHLISMYLKDFFIPYPLVYWHGLGYIPFRSWDSIIVIFGALFSMGSISYAIYSFRKYQMLSYGILFFFISISVYLMLFIQIPDTMADRFMFIPSFGLSLALIAGAFEMMEVIKKKQKNKYGLLFNIFTLYLIILTFLAWNRNKVWENDFTLVSHDIKYLKDSSKPNYHYATELQLKLVSTTFDPNIEKEMIDHYKRSISLSDSAYYARLDLANYYHAKENFKECLPIYKQMIELFPNASDAYYYLGKVYVQNKNFTEAIKKLNKAIDLSPKSSDSYYLLSLSYSRTGNYKQAKDLAIECLNKFPQFRNDFYSVLSETSFYQGDLDQSTLYSLERIKYNANPYNVYATIIGRYQNAEDVESAQKYYLEAVQKGIMK